jgi:hypothetical protein
MSKFLQFNAPNQSVVYVDPRQVVRIYPRLTGGGSSLNLSNGQTQDVLESMDEVLADLEGTD